MSEAELRSVVRELIAESLRGLRVHTTKRAWFPDREALLDAYEAAASEDPEGFVSFGAMLELLDAAGFPGLGIRDLREPLLGLGLRLADDGTGLWVVPRN